MKLLLFIYFYLVLLCFFSNNGVNSYGESDSNGTPSWRERESLALLNFVRMHPIAYRDLYMKNYANYTTMFTKYTSVKPLYFNAGVTSFAQGHSKDMGDNNCFSHNSCSGTTFSSRVLTFSSSCSSLSSAGENIAAGSANGFLANNMLICDAPDPNNPVCTYDGSDIDGHRRNFMSSTYKIVGIGYYNAPSSTYKNYYTQDFFGNGCDIPTSSIYSGFHSITNNGLHFVVSYYDANVPITKMSLAFENNTKITLSNTYGTSNSATFLYTQATFTNCVKYYFEATTASSTIRYPDTGYLQLTKDNTCDAWAPSTSTGTTSTTSSSTTGSLTTSSSTTSKTTTSTSTSTTGSSTTSKTTSTTSSGSSTTSKTTTTTTSSTTTATTATPTTSLTTPKPQEEDDDSVSNSNILKPTLVLLSILILITMY